MAAEFLMKLEHLEAFKKWLDAIGREYKVPKTGPLLIISSGSTNYRDRIREDYKVVRVKHSRKWVMVPDFASGLVLRFYKAILKAREELQARQVAHCGLDNTSYRPPKGKTK